MRSINSLSLTPAVNEWLINTRYLHILHIFDRACNLINEQGEVLSVVTPQIGNGPFNLVLEKDVCFSEYLSLESPISVSRSQLTLGDLVINLATSKPWSPRPDWETLHARRNHILPQLNQLPITNYQTTPSDLSTALVSADIPTAMYITTQLAGLGPGLTPSGDDVLMGAIYATWIIQTAEIASLIVKEIANTAAPLTTSLSRAWLRCAGKGEAGIQWHNLFRALIAGEDLQFPITKLLSIGETSGADALAGFMNTITCWGESHGSKFHSFSP